ncbi:MAG: TIGR03032 family protein, partial [Pirellulales bacterium]
PTSSKPMGMAAGRGRLAVGTAQEIVLFRDVPAVSARLEPPSRHDVCFLPRAVHVTGDIQIHEMVYQEDELWFVNTAFSCLCTYDDDHSFVPRWRPRFVTELVPEDRCHLNGLGLQEGKPRWVTALGETDAPGGWRENKKDGGVLIDLESNSIVARGLSMPHSPRWHGDRLWLEESGTGSLGTIDLSSGNYESIVQLPGFTRGLDFAGNLAFVGLSQVRETAVFGGIPLTERLDEAERTCGVWAIDTESGQVVAFVKFEQAVQEIFAVTVLRGARCPELVMDNPKITGSSFVLPDEALRDVPGRLRGES